MTVVAAPPHYPEWRVYPGYRARRLPPEVSDGLVVRRVPILLSDKPTGARARIAYDLSFAIGAMWQAWCAPATDLLVCVAPPILAGLAAVLAARRHRAPLVIIVQDLELQLASQLAILRPGWMLRLAGWIERVVYAEAAAISVISDSFAAYLRSTRVPAHKIHVLPNWVDTQLIRPLPRGAFLSERCGFPSSSQVVLYSGNIGEKQGLDTLVRAAPLLRKHEIHVVLVGDGLAKQALAQLADDLGACNVHFLPLQPRADLPAMLASADVLALVQRPEVVDSVAPSKLLVYMASGRPIVAAANAASEVVYHVTAAKCGVVVPPGDHGALAAAIVAACADKHQRTAWGANARRYAEQYFSRTRVVEQYEQLFRNALASSAR
jgi:colanic acid biosynthesis glycosyl transferase WcaI